MANNINLSNGNGITFNLSTSDNTLTIQIDKTELNSILQDLRDDSGSVIQEILTRLTNLESKLYTITTRVTGIENAVIVGENRIDTDTTPINWELTKEWARAVLKGDSTDTEDTLYGLKQELIGTSSDTSSANTIKGAKKYTDKLRTDLTDGTTTVKNAEKLYLSGNITDYKTGAEIMQLLKNKLTGSDGWTNNSWKVSDADKLDSKHASDFATSGHTHDDRYYTESEVNSKLSGKSNTGHTHTVGELTDLPISNAANKPDNTTTGTLYIKY